MKLINQKLKKLLSNVNVYVKEHLKNQKRKERMIQGF